jgi:fucose permease
MLLLMFGSYFMFGMVMNVLGVVIPLVITQYHLTLFVAGLLAFAFYIAVGLLSVPAGVLADRFGSRAIVLFGLGLMTLSCAGIAWIHLFPVMATLTFGIGAGVAFLQTAGNPLIILLDKAENYHRNLTLTIGFCGVGAFIGPFILSSIQNSGHAWQFTYAIFAILLAILFVALSLMSFPAVAPSTEKFKLSQVGTLLVHPIVMVYALGIFFYVAAEVGTASWIVKFFEQVHGIGLEKPLGGTLLARLAPSLPALTVALFWGLQGLGRLVSSYGIQKIGGRSVLRTYSVLALAALLVAVYGPTPIVAWAFAACGFFTSVLFTLIFSGAVQSFSASQSTVSGILCAASIGGAFAPPLIGLVAEHAGMRTGMLIPAACFVVVSGIAFFGNARYE